MKRRAAQSLGRHLLGWSVVFAAGHAGGAPPAAGAPSAAAQTSAAQASAEQAAVPRQEPDDRPQFEVASIRPSKDAAARGGMMVSRDRVTISNETIHWLIANAYRLRDDQVVGGPGWLTSDRYDIVASGTETAVATGTNRDARSKLMLQRLLEDRFGLRVHRESRELPVYELRIAKGGLKMPVQPEGTCVDMWKPHPPLDPASRTGANFCDTWQVHILGRLNGAPVGRLIGTGIVLQDPAQPYDGLVPTLTGVAGRPVLDRTGLTGTYQVHLEWTPDTESAQDSATSSPGATLPTAPSLFTALEEQLGLELRPSRGAVSVLVIDSVARPSEN